MLMGVGTPALVAGRFVHEPFPGPRPDLLRKPQCLPCKLTPFACITIDFFATLLASMNSTTYRPEAKEPTSRWMSGLGIWIGLGLVSLLASFPVSLVLNQTFERLAGIISIAGGVLIAGAMVRSKKNRELYASVEPLPIKRAIAVLLMPLFIAVLSWANFYILLFAIHSATAKPAALTLTVSAKAKPRPYREQWASCKQYLHFRELAWYPGGKYCVELDVLNRIQRGGRFPLLF